MGIDSLMVVCEDLICIDLNQIECNIVGIGLNRICEILNHKGRFRNLYKLNRQSELPGQNQNLDDLFRNNILVHILQEAESLLMSKDNVSSHHILFFSLILNHNGEEIQEFYHSLLVLVYLSMLYRNKLVSNVSGDVQHAIGRQKMCNHFDVICFKQD